MERNLWSDEKINNFQKKFLLFSFPNIFDNGMSTKTVMCIVTNASIKIAPDIGKPLLELAATILGINNKVINKNFLYLFCI